MSTVFESFQKKSFFPVRPFKDDLPISQGPAAADAGSLRRRLTSTFSCKIQPLANSASAAASWSFRRSKSMSSIGELASGWSLKRWWNWGFGWILSRKPSFASDLEMNDQETAMLGFHGKGSWRHVLYKVRAEIRRIVGSGAPARTGFGYDSFSYKQNFDDGLTREV